MLPFRRLCLCLLVTSSCTAAAPESVDLAAEPPFPTRREPVHSQGRTLGYVSNSLSDSITILDLDELRTIDERGVGRNPVDLDGPHHLALDEASDSLYVALSYPTPVGASAPHAGHGETSRFGYVQRRSLTDLRLLSEHRVHPNPGDLVLSPSGSQLLVSHYDLRLAQSGEDLESKRASILSFDDAQRLGQADAAPRSRVLCIAPHAIVYSRDGARAFVTCTREDSILSLDAASLEVLEHVPVAESVGQPNRPAHEPYAAALSPDGARLLVSNLASRSITSFAVGAGLERETTLSLSGSPYFPAWLADDRHALIPLQAPDGAALVDITSGETVTSALYTGAECQAPHEARITRLGQFFLVCEGNHEDPGSVVELNPDTLAVERRLAVGIFPDRMLVREPR